MSANFLKMDEGSGYLWGGKLYPPSKNIIDDANNNSIFWDEGLVIAALKEMSTMASYPNHVRRGEELFQFAMLIYGGIPSFPEITTGILAALVNIYSKNI